jgi:hypothetical protein
MIMSKNLTSILKVFTKTALQLEKFIETTTQQEADVQQEIAHRVTFQEELIAERATATKVLVNVRGILGE